MSLDFSYAGVCIPTIAGAPDMTADLLTTLGADPVVEYITLFVNAPDAVDQVKELVARAGLELDGTATPTITLMTVGEHLLYPSWNVAIGIARSVGVPLMILNDDIRFPDPDPVSRLVAVWRENPDIAVMGFDHTGDVPPGKLERCTGSYRHGGIPGFAFGVDPIRVEPVDTRFEWWYGDDDLFRTTELNGYPLARAGVHVWHEAETTAVRQPWTREAADRDRIRWVDKYGDV